MGLTSVGWLAVNNGHGGGSIAGQGVGISRRDSHANEGTQTDED